MKPWLCCERHGRSAGRRGPGRLRGYVAAGLALLLAAAGAAEESASIHGLPFTRNYSLEDIGYGPRGANLNFDRFGRLAVVHDGVYAVLNDTVWHNIAADTTAGEVPMANVVQGTDGRMYYGGRGSWGLAEIQSDGLLHARPLVPADAPAWVRSVSFTDLIVTRQGVYFASAGGIVFWDAARHEHQWYEFSRIAKAFSVGDTVYVSAFEQPLGRIDVDRRVIEPVGTADVAPTVVVAATGLDEGRSLICLLDGRLLVFDGATLVPWKPQHRAVLNGPVAVMQHMVDGYIALGITGRGLLLFSSSGELVLALDTPQYQRITALANREPGVLWVATEDGIDKVLYSSSLTTFGQQLGLTVSWPIIERWNGHLYIESGGQLYQAAEGAPGAPTRFELCPFQPPGGTWALAAWGPHMLVGGPDRIYAVDPDGQLRPVAAVRDVAHLVMFDAEHCYAIARTEIALLEWRNGGWTETAPRTRGVTYPSVVHRVRNSAWIEMGGQVGRLWLHDGRPQFDIIPNAEWTTKPWVNIGAIDNTVVLSASDGVRRFFDEETGAWSDAPRIRQILDRAPFWLARMQKDDSGTIWATCADGLIRFVPDGRDYELDTSTFDLINDRYPVLHVLPDNDVWIFGSQSLYHVERRWATGVRRDQRPVLVSLTNDRGGEILTSDRDPGTAIRLPFSKGGLTFRFFSGSDVRRRAPVYQYRLTEREPWTAMAGSQLSFRGLFEGSYRLSVRMQEKNGRPGPEATIPFEVLPPWYRTWPAYLVYASLGAMLLVGIMRWASVLERRRNRQLEQVVHERTRQLEDAMTRLGEETRNAATLAERDRLANEIHDSVQQGLTGAILQLDTTLTLPAVGGDLRSRLDVVRNMVSYARQEVQHAVWDMESPLLEGTELADALRNLTTFASSGETTVEVGLTGVPFPLDRTTSHNLLRIAQEATTNACRHSKARRIEISLAYRPGAVGLEICDDGVGFSPDAVLQEKVGHLGLRGIRTRVRKLRGHLEIRSSPHGGTAVRVEVPVPPPEHSNYDAKADGQ